MVLLAVGLEQRNVRKHKVTHSSRSELVIQVLPVIHQTAPCGTCSPIIVNSAHPLGVLQFVLLSFISKLHPTPHIAVLFSLSFIRLLIPSKFAEYNQQDATFHNLFISVRSSTCFRRFFRPSSGAQNCTYSVRHLSDRYCYPLLARASSG